MNENTELTSDRGVEKVKTVPVVQELSGYTEPFNIKTDGIKNGTDIQSETDVFIHAFKFEKSTHSAHPYYAVQK